MRLACLLLLPLSACTVVVAGHCADGVVNSNESDVDCGGSCAACANGRRCLFNGDCASGVCGTNGVCGAILGHCADGARDADESDVDCGGSCAACANGRLCSSGFDCLSGVCSAGGVCSAPSGLPSSAGADVYHIDPGASLIISPGQQAGYGILANTGGSFRLVWTGEGAATGTFSSFSGTVWTTAVIDSVTPGCAANSCGGLEAGDTVTAPTAVSGGYRVDFSALASVGLDGFDFTVTAESINQPVYFDLFIDNLRHKELIFFSSSGAAANAGTVPFGLTTQ